MDDNKKCLNREHEIPHMVSAISPIHIFWSPKR